MAGTKNNRKTITFIAKFDPETDAMLDILAQTREHNRSSTVRELIRKAHAREYGTARQQVELAPQ